MDLIEATLEVLTEGVKEGSTDVVALRTTAAANGLWNAIKRRLGKKPAELDVRTAAALDKQPGDLVSLTELRHLLSVLPQPELAKQLTVYGDYVARDKITYNF